MEEVGLASDRLALVPYTGNGDSKETLQTFVFDAVTRIAGTTASPLQGK
jgi:hypothetical protein